MCEETPNCHCRTMIQSSDDERLRNTHINAEPESTDFFIARDQIRESVLSRSQPRERIILTFVGELSNFIGLYRLLCLLQVADSIA